MKMRVADYIADFIYRAGVQHVFMMGGGGSIYLDDGIVCHKHLKHIAVRNEAAAPMMAEAYARITQNLGAVYVTTGPGGTNAVAGLAEAWVDSAPIIIISGQVEKKYTTYNSGVKGLRTVGCQEINIVDVVKPMTKYATMVNNPNSIRYHLEKAVFYAKSGRPGPVWLDIPLDVQSAEIDVEDLHGFVAEPVYPDILGRDVDKIINEFQQAEKPLLIIGQGVRQSGAISRIEKLVERLKIPVISSRLGQDILPFSYKYNCGHGGMRGSQATTAIMKDADFILSVGSRLAIPFVGMKLNAFSNSARIAAVDIEWAELVKNGVHIDIAIHGDAGDFLFKLNYILNSEIAQIIIPDYSKWTDKCIEQKEEKSLVNFNKESNPIDLYHFVSRLDALSNEKHIFVSSAGSAYFVTGQSLSFNKGQREVTSGAFASMGVGIPLGIGSAVAAPNNQVLVVTGDGSLELNIQELKTLSQYNLNVKLFVINNGGYVSIRNAQDHLFDGRYINSDQVGEDHLLDFSKIADAFELRYRVIDDYKKIDESLKEIMADSGPMLVEVVCDNKQNIVTNY